MIKQGQRFSRHVALKWRQPWRKITSNTSSQMEQQNGSVGGRQGLYSIPQLLEPTSFPLLAQQAMKTCDDLCAVFQKMDDSSTVESSKEAVQTLYQLDEISRVVCNVIDAAELCRSTHANVEWRQAAQEAFTILSDYIGQLNGNVHLYKALRGMNAWYPHLTEEQQRFARLLQAEFEHDGIHLPDATRNQVREIQNSIVQLEGQFQQNLVDWHRTFLAPRSEVEAIVPRHVLTAMFGITSPKADGSSATNDNKNNSNMDDLLQMTSNSQLLQTLLKYSPSPSLRKQVYMEYHTAVPENFTVLQQLRNERHQLARTLGYESFADRVVANNKMATSTQAVQTFLTELAHRNTPVYLQELQMIAKAKQHMEGATDGSAVQPWDIPYVTTCLKAESGYNPHEVSRYLSLKHCLEAIQLLCRDVFGIELVEHPIAPADRWDGIEDGDNEDERVRCFVAHERETERPLGTMYLDLHPRPGKFGHAAHFTVRCGCVVNGSQQHEEPLHQLPIVALVCNLSSSSGALSHGEVETLFHEMGHALHSLLSRTSFQHVSGTRTAMDFVETPSHVIENFVWDPTFLKLLAVDQHTGEPIPDELITKLVQSRYQLHALERQTQILYALYDQALFGVPSSSRTATDSMAFSLESSTDLLAQTHNQLQVPYVPGTHWHSRFGHLITYGAGYYSYLYAQEFAQEIWKIKFQNNCLHLPTGQEFWHKLLIHGGAKDPHLILEDLLGTSKSEKTSISSMPS